MTESPPPMSDKLLRIAAKASLGFVVAVIAAAILHPGGNLLSVDAKWYSITANAFCDLVMIHTHAGRRNTVSMPLFVVATALAGIAVATVVPGWLLRNAAGPMFTTAMTTLAAVTGLGFVCVGLTPADKLLFWHGISVNTAFASFAVLLMAMTTWAWRNVTASYCGLRRPSWSPYWCTTASSGSGRDSRPPAGSSFRSLRKS